MTTQNIHEELQFDYFSQNYYQFQEDFYQFYQSSPASDGHGRMISSAIWPAAKSLISKLSKAKSLDQKDHYFHFTVSRPDQAKTTLYLPLSRPNRRYKSIKLQT